MTQTADYIGYPVLGLLTVLVFGSSDADSPFKARQCFGL